MHLDEHTYSSFLQTWETAIKEPEALIFSIFHYNIIHYIVEYGNVGPYERDLINNMAIGLKDGNVIVDFLDQVDPESITNITRIAAEKFRDSHALQQVLRSLFSSLNSDIFIAVTRELIKKSINNSKGEDVDVLICNLIRYLLQKYSLGNLKKLAKKTFSKVFFFPFKQIIMNEAITNEGVQQEINLVWEYLLELVVDRRELFNNYSRKDFLEQLFHSNNYWLRDRDHILRIVRNLFHAGNNPNLDSLTSIDRNVIVEETARRICINFIREFLGEYYPPGQRMNEPYDRNHFYYLSTLTVNLIYNSTYDRNMHRTSFQHTLVSNSISVFLDLLSRSLCKELPLDVIAVRFDTFVSDYQKSINEKSSDTEIDSFDFSFLFFQFMEAMAEELLDNIISLLPVIQKKSFENRIAFLELILAEFVNEISNAEISSLPSQISRSQC